MVLLPAPGPPVTTTRLTLGGSRYVALEIERLLEQLMARCQCFRRQDRLQFWIVQKVTGTGSISSNEPQVHQIPATRNVIHARVECGQRVLQNFVQFYFGIRISALQVCTEEGEHHRSAIRVSGNALQCCIG